MTVHTRWLLRRWPVWLLICAWLWQPVLARADSRSAAVLIVPGGGAAITSVCVPFTEETLSGAELLRRAQVNLVTQISLVGEAVCKIGNTGCAYPAENCFCQCLGAQCSYWSYWYREGEQWVYSGKGGGSRSVRPGDLDAWIWGDGQTPPPAASWRAICAAPQAAGASSLSGAQGVVASTPPLERGAPEDAYPAPQDHTPTPPSNPDPYPGAAPTNTRAPTASAPGETPAERATATVRPTATPRLTATPLERPDSPTPRAGLAPTTMPHETRLATTAPGTAPPSPMLPETPMRDEQTPEAEPSPAIASAAPETPSPDAVAMRLREGVARARATAAARNLEAAQTSGGGIGYFVALVILMVALVGYALLLRRQRAATLHQAGQGLASASAPGEPDEATADGEAAIAKEAPPSTDDEAS